jgi:hypothetical protein
MLGALRTVSTFRPRFSSEEVAQLQALAAARKVWQFAEFVDRITKLVPKPNRANLRHCSR